MYERLFASCVVVVCVVLMVVVVVVVVEILDFAQYVILSRRFY